jgi:hypothetical protein
MMKKRHTITKRDVPSDSRRKRKKLGNKADDASVVNFLAILNSPSICGLAAIL